MLIAVYYVKLCLNLGSFWGDPHFLTLDGKGFTFNGLGEYILLDIETDNVTFVLQARTRRATKENGDLSDATVFSAFAAFSVYNNTNASMHVELNNAKDGMFFFQQPVKQVKVRRQKKT